MDPETQQQEVPPHSIKKVILFSLAAVGAIILLIVISVLSVNSGKKVPANGTDISKPTDTPPKSTIDSAKQGRNATPTIVAGLKSYKNAQFSINYPNDWQITEIRSKDDSGISIKPLFQLAANPTFVVITRSVSSVPNIQQMQQEYIRLGFTQTSSQIDGQNATRIQGTIPPTNIALPSATSEIVRATHIFFNKGEVGFLLKYTYISSGVNPELENTFLRIISSFTFN